MARPTVLTPRVRGQLGALLDAGVTQQVAANALGISRRSVTRYVGGERGAGAPQTLAELIATLPTVEQVVADAERPQERRRRRRRAPKQWEEAAAFLAASAPERWGG